MEKDFNPFLNDMPEELFFDGSPEQVSFYHEDYDHDDVAAFEEYFMPFGEAYFNERQGY